MKFHIHTLVWELNHGSVEIGPADMSLSYGRFWITDQVIVMFNMLIQ